MYTSRYLIKKQIAEIQAIHRIDPDEFRDELIENVVDMRMSMEDDSEYERVHAETVAHFATTNYRRPK